MHELKLKQGERGAKDGTRVRRMDLWKCFGGIAPKFYRCEQRCTRADPRRVRTS